MGRFAKVLLTDCNVICAAGGKSDLLQGLHKKPQDTLRVDHNLLKDRPGYFGFVDLPEAYQNNSQGKTCRILHYLVDEMKDSVERLKSSYRPDRVAVIIGTTTTGIREAERCESVSIVDYHNHQELSAVSENLANYCGFRGPNLVVSTACTSGAKALGLARKLIEDGWCDAALAGASESLNRVTCQGFDALESYSLGVCKPFQPDRDGINIGEGAALFILEKGDSGIAITGFSESSDAWHESAPDPTGNGAEVAIKSAMIEAGIDSSELSYINLHGTGTRLNDSMEASVIHRIFGENLPVSSTKAVMGHTLGAAGAIEAAILWLMLDQAGPVQLPPHHGAEYFDSKLPKINLVDIENNPPSSLKRLLSVSFAFGGHNSALVLERVVSEQSG